MKKLSVLLAILSISMYGLQAQNDNEGKMGFKGGGNFSNFRGDDAGDSQMKTGFHLGGFITLPLGNISLQHELMISTRGARWDNNNNNNDISTNLLYIDLPMMLKFYFTDNFNMHLGGQVGYLMSATTKKDPEPYTDYDENVSDQFRNLDYGALAGLEFESDLGFLMGLRYYHGLANLGDDYESKVNIAGNIIITEKEALDLQNSMFQVFIGVGF